MDWIEANTTLIRWAIVLSTVMFVGGLVIMPLLVARMRADYFLHAEPTEENWGGRHPVLRITFLTIRNLLGALLLLVGLAMLVLPGQGIITILVSISLLSFPGKRSLELRIVRQGPVLHAINWIRARAGRPPLRLPPSKKRP